MKKTVKIMSVLLLVTILLASVGSVVFAASTSSNTEQASTSSNPEQVLGAMQNAAQNGSANGTEEITTLGGRIVSIVQVVGVVIAVVIILVIGIKYMIGSAEEKAEYKKTMMPYLVGAILIFAGSTIVNVVYNLVTGLR